MYKAKRRRDVDFLIWPKYAINSFLIGIMNGVAKNMIN